MANKYDNGEVNYFPERLIVFTYVVSMYNIPRMYKILPFSRTEI